jgi:hypothetical protein
VDSREAEDLICLSGNNKMQKLFSLVFRTRIARLVLADLSKVNLRRVGGTCRGFGLFRKEIWRPVGQSVGEQSNPSKISIVDPEGRFPEWLGRIPEGTLASPSYRGKSILD